MARPVIDVVTNCHAQRLRLCYLSAFVREAFTVESGDQRLPEPLERREHSPARASPSHSSSQVRGAVSTIPSMAVNHSTKQSTRSPLGMEPSLGVAPRPGNVLPLWRQLLTACAVPARHSLGPLPGFFFFPPGLTFTPLPRTAHLSAGYLSRAPVGWASAACLCLH